MTGALCSNSAPAGMAPVEGRGAGRQCYHEAFPGTTHGASPMAFRSTDEFKQIFEQIFELMNEHPEVGRTLRDAQAPHAFEIADMGVTFHVNAAPAADEAEGRYLVWTWDTPPWDPLITMSMSSEVANRFFQGKENVLLAVTLGRVKLKGPMAKIIELAPVTKPIHSVYREWLKANGYPHLVA